MGIATRMAQQARKPSGGLLGWFVERNMTRQGQPIVDWAIELLDIQVDDRVLEVGFGLGSGIAGLAAAATEGLTAGVDVSERMVAKASSRNAAAIKAGRVDLREGDVLSLPYEDEAFDKAMAIQNIFVWPDPVEALKEIRRVLKPGGTVIHAGPSKEDMQKRKFATVGVLTLYSDEEQWDMLKAAGFKDIQIRATRTLAYERVIALMGVK